MPPGQSVPPPGYIYVPVVTPTAPALSLQEGTRRELLASELARVDARLAELQRARKSIARPIVRMVIGYGAMVAFTAAALGTYASAEAIEHRRYDHWGNHDGDNLDVTHNGVVNHHDEDVFRREARVFTGLAAVGAVIGISGTIRLIANSAQRRVINSERKNLLARRSSLRQQLDYGASVSPGAVQVGVQGRF